MKERIAAGGRTRRRGRIPRTLLTLILVMVVSGCPNLNQDLDLKSQIANDVLVANAELIPVRIQPEGEAMGVTNPPSPYSAKIGVPFIISTTISADYAFVKWEQVGGNGEVTFADPAKSETQATIGKKGADIQIVARFDARPKVIVKDPDGGEGVLRNRTIVITFSEPLDPATVSFTAVSVEARSRNSTQAPASIADRLTLAVQQSSVVISLQPGKQFDAQNYIWIKLSKSITDLAHNQMKEDFSWYFITGNSSDNFPPVINTFEIKAGGAALAADGKTKSLSLILNADAADDGIMRTIRITETALADINGTALSAQAATTDFDYAASLPYVLITPGDGRKNIEVRVLDTLDHLSDPASNTLVLDTTGPAASSFSAACGPATNQDTVTIQQAVTDGALGSPASAIQASYSMNGGTWQTWQPLSPTQVLPISGSGTITISAKYKDELGNETGSGAISSVSVIRDTVAPVISSHQVDHGAYPDFTKVVGISVSFNAADESGGSGVAGYEVTENATPSGSWVTWSGGAKGNLLFNLASVVGAHTVYFHVRDGAGNQLWRRSPFCPFAFG